MSGASIKSKVKLVGVFVSLSGLAGGAYALLALLTSGINLFSLIGVFTSLILVLGGVGLVINLKFAYYLVAAAILFELIIDIATFSIISILINISILGVVVTGFMMRDSPVNY